MKIHLRKAMIAAAFVAASLVLSSCEDDEASSIAAAQDCLNEMRATMDENELATKAAQCRSLLGTATSEKGFIVECSSYFLQEGFFSSQVIKAFERIEDNQENPALSVLSVFAFKNDEIIDDTELACSQTGLKTLKVFGSLAKTATTIAHAFPGGIDALFSGGEVPDIEDFKDALNNMSDAELEAMGASVVSLSQTLCASGKGSFDEACPTLNAVTAASDNETIGKCMRFCMADNARKGQACDVEASITCPN